MERAGEAAFAELKQRWPRVKKLGVLCGAGNNGGDGFVVARLAQETGYEVSVWQLGECKLGSDADSARERMEATGLEVKRFDPGALASQEIVVDGLLGTGLNAEIKGQWREAIIAINEARELGARVLSLDIPSGLNANTGSVMGVAVEADCCVSFIGLKQGCLTGEGPDYCGDVIFDDLGVPARVYSRISRAAKRMSCPNAATILPPRKRATNKGHYGHVLVVGGDYGMSGAVRLAAEGAARTGAGLVSVATHAEHAAVISAAVPELMCHGVEDVKELMPLMHRANVVACRTRPWDRGHGRDGPS